MHKVGQKLAEDFYGTSLLDVPCKNKGLCALMNEGVFTKKNKKIQVQC